MKTVCGCLSHEGFLKGLLESGAHSAIGSHFRPIRRFHGNRMLKGLPPSGRHRTLGIPDHTPNQARNLDGTQLMNAYSASE